MKFNKFSKIIIAVLLMLSVITFGFAQRGGGFGGRSGGFSSSSSSSFGGSSSRSSGFGGRSGSFGGSISSSPSRSSVSSSSSGFGGRSGSFGSSSSSSSGYGSRGSTYSPPRVSTSYSPSRRWAIGARPTTSYTSTYVYGGRTIYWYPGGGYSYMPGGPVVGYYDPGVVVPVSGTSYLWLEIIGGIVVLGVIIVVATSMRSL